MSRFRIVFICMIGLLSASRAACAEEGLILHYTFDEVSGNIVRDKSGFDHDGEIVSSPGSEGRAEWIQEKNRRVLGFDGGIYIKAGTKLNTLIGQSGTLEIWCLPEEITGGLISWHAGADWRDQRLVLGFLTYMDSRLIGVLANGREATFSTRHLHVVEKGKWSHYVMTFDETNIHLYVDGEPAQTIPVQEGVAPDLDNIPLCIGRNEGLGGDNFRGKMAEVCVYNRPLSAQEIRGRYTDGVKQLGIELPRTVGVRTILNAKQHKLTVECNLAKAPDLPRGARLSVLLRNRKKVLQQVTIPIPRDVNTVPVVLPTASLLTGTYDISVAVKEGNRDLVEPKTITWYFPEIAQRIGAPPGRTILNNLVTQLLAAQDLPAKGYQEVSFINPRKGWVFISTTVESGNRGTITVSVDGEKKDAVIVHGAGTRVEETMRFLGPGAHKLRIWSESETGGQPPRIGRLVARAVPAMMYCGWPGFPHTGSQEYGFKFLARDVLPNINTFVGQAHADWDADRAEWKRRSGQCLLEQPIPTLIRSTLKDVPYPLTGDYAYNYWTKSPGFTHPSFDGVVGDEFAGGESQDFIGYIDAVRRVAANPDYKDKSIHAWVGPVMTLSQLSSRFVGTVIDCGYKLAWEEYLVESPTVEEAEKMFETRIRKGMEQWVGSFPDFPHHAIFVLFISSAPPETANINPSVDYKVFLDMQFRHLATSPECFGLWGVMIYKATYADEEALRWAGRLFRHYCIEGNTDLLSKQYGFSYNLRHIRNPDFDDGLTGWESDPAEPGSVTTGRMYGLHGLLTRYHGKDEGNHFLLMKRSARKPNKVSQEIVGLKAGQCYSLKIFVADHGDLVQARSEKKRMTVSVHIENADMLPEKCFVSELQSYQAVAQYAGKAPPFMNYHRLVFRARGETARLTLSDWAGDTIPAGPVGQETLINFIEVQPYLE